MLICVTPAAASFRPISTDAFVSSPATREPRTFSRDGSRPASRTYLLQPWHVGNWITERHPAIRCARDTTKCDFAEPRPQPDRYWRYRGAIEPDLIECVIVAVKRNRGHCHVNFCRTAGRRERRCCVYHATC